MNATRSTVTKSLKYDLRESNQFKKFRKQIDHYFLFIHYLEERQTGPALEHAKKTFWKKAVRKLKGKERRASKIEYHLTTAAHKALKKIVLLQDKSPQHSSELRTLKAEVQVNLALTLRNISYPQGAIHQQLIKEPLREVELRKVLQETTTALQSLTAALSQLVKINQEIKTTTPQNHSLFEEYNPYDVSSTVKVFFKAKDMYSSAIADIKSAKHSVYLETFTINPDEVGKEFSRALIAKAQEFNKRNKGKVVLIIDGGGSPSGNSHLEKMRKIPLFNRFINNMRKNGVRVHIFNPPKNTFLKYNAFDVLLHPLKSLAHRDHRKLIVIDSQIAYVGGMNLTKKYHKLRDTHSRISGPVVFELAKSFRDMLYLTKKYEKIALKDQSYDEPLFLSHSKSAHSSIQVVVNKPSLLRHTIRDRYIHLIDNAKEEINITNPYFIPGWKFINHLCHAAKRGVKVRIILSKQSDHPCVDRASHAYFPKMLKAGVEIHLYSKPGVEFVHAKTMTVDRIFTTLGSSNLDYVSLSIDYELNVIIANTQTTAILNEQFQEDLKYCKELDQPSLSKLKNKGGLWGIISGAATYRILGPSLHPTLPGYE